MALNWHLNPISQLAGFLLQDRIRTWVYTIIYINRYKCENLILCHNNDVFLTSITSKKKIYWSPKTKKKVKFKLISLETNFFKVKAFSGNTTKDIKKTFIRGKIHSVLKKKISTSTKVKILFRFMHSNLWMRPFVIAVWHKCFLIRCHALTMKKALSFKNSAFIVL